MLGGILQIPLMNKDFAQFTRNDVGGQVADAEEIELILFEAAFVFSHDDLMKHAPPEWYLKQKT